MKNLLKTYGLSTENEYFQMIAESFIEGQRKQAIEQFNAMPQECKVKLVKLATIHSEISDFTPSQISDLIDNL